MACLLTTGFTLDCNDNSGGIEEILIGNFSEITSFTDLAGEITAITQDGVTSFYRYELEQEDSDLITTENRSAENGTLFYETVLNFTIDKLAATKSEELKIMAQARKLVILAKLTDGQYVAMGFDRGAMKQGGTNQMASGKAYGDKQGYTIGLTSKENHYPYFTTQAVVDTLTIA